MASKKYSFLIGVLCLIVSGSVAQVGTNYNVLDSTYYSTKSLPQFNEFRNNAYPFPPKPRDQWELGVKAGIYTIFGDVSPIIPTLGAGLHVRKSFGYVGSVRLNYSFGTAKGLGYGNRTAGFSQPFELNYPAPGATVYDNYKMTSHELSVDGILTINNIRFHKAKTNFVVYGFGGIGAMVYQTKVDALNASGAPYNFSTVPAGGYDNKKEIRNYLKDNLNIGDSYESDAESEGEAQLFDMDLKPTLSGGVGMAFRLGKMVNLAIEDRVSMAFSDLLDGQRYQNAETGPSGRILSPNNDIANFFSVGLNFNLGKKAIEPLWWQNPLDYAYNELNAPKHMKLPKPVLDDADGDGITDQFDNEPNTPANTPVDSHGVSRDTDGDGVPDSKDKELITPTQCQPVDADGVGTCPPPACCALIDSLMKIQPKGCGIGDLPSVSFSGRSVALSNDAKAVLTSVADKMRNNPNCRVAVIGYGESSKSAQQLSWDRVNAVINHLVEKEGISTDRFIFKYGEGGGDPGTVDLREGTNDEGPNTVPAPHPNLRRKG